jgi:hypothetical protein
MSKHKKKFGVYHWDTFDNTSLFLKDFDTEEEAEAFVHERYAGRIRSTGADRVDIVEGPGHVVQSFSVS